MGLILVNRSFESSLARALLQPNRALWILLGGVLSLLGVAVYWQPAQSLFHFGKLHWNDLAICLAVGTVSLVGLEALKSRLFRTRNRQSAKCRCLLDILAVHRTITKVVYQQPQGYRRQRKPSVFGPQYWLPYSALLTKLDNSPSGLDGWARRVVLRASAPRSESRYCSLLLSLGSSFLVLIVSVNQLTTPDKKIWRTRRRSRLLRRTQC